MFETTTDKFVAYKALINTWLQDPINKQETAMALTAIKESRQALDKDTGANKNNDMRLGVSLPDTLLRALEKYEREHNSRFFTEEQNPIVAKKQMHEFMRRFPMFCRPTKI